MTLNEVNATSDPLAMESLFPFLGPSRANDLIVYRPWDGYVSLVEILQLPGQTVWDLAEMQLSALVRTPSSDPNASQAVMDIRAFLYVMQDPAFPKVPHAEMAKLLLWTEPERQLLLSYVNTVSPQELQQIWGFEDVQPAEVNTLYAGAPYATMVDALSNWARGTDHLRRARSDLLAYNFVPPGDGMGGPGHFVDGNLPTLFLPVRLEVRYLGTDLAVRVYPDNVHIADHRTGLIETPALNEHALGTQFWVACITAQWEEQACRAAWEGLCDPIGPHRSVHVVNLTAPNELAALRTDPNVPYNFPDPVGAGDEASVIFGMPEYWTFRLKLRDGTLIVERGRPIDHSLQVGVTDPQDPEPMRRWLVDFDEAVDKGMAVRIPSAAFAATGLESLQVFGINVVTKAEDFIAHVEAQAMSHGLAFAPDGAATNNTPEHPALFTQDWAREARWEEVWRLIQEDLTAGGAPNASAFTDALGVGESIVLANLPGADDGREVLATELMGPVYDKIFKPALDFAIGSGVIADESALRAFAVNTIRPHGPFSTFRLGKQPYAVLPYIHPVGRPPTPFLNDVMGVVRRVGKEYDAVLPAFDGTTAEVSTLARTAYPSYWSTQTFDNDPDHQTNRDRVQDFADDLPSNVDAQDTSNAGDQSFVVLQTYVQDILDWDLNGGTKPTVHNSLSDVVAPYDPHAEKADLFSEAVVEQAVAVSKCRSRHVPDEWTTMRSWSDATIAQAKVTVADDAKYRPLVSTGGARDANEADARAAIGKVPGLAATHRTLGSWTSQITVLEDELFFARNKLLEDPVRVEIADLLGRVWPPPPPLVSGTFGQLPTGSPATPDGVTLEGETDPFLDGDPATVPEFWTTTPEGLSGTPLLDLLVADPDLLRSTYDAERLEWMLRGATAALGTRPDAWHTAISKATLSDLRGKQDQGMLPEGSAFIGGYGFLLDVPAQDEVAPEDSEGFMLAPSMGHAATAAVLRSGWLSRNPDDPRQPMAVKLEAARTRTARAMLTAIGEGADPGPWLGRRIEEALLDIEQSLPPGTPSELGPFRLEVMDSQTTPIDGFTALEILAAQDEGEYDGDTPTLTMPRGLQALRQVADEVDAIHDLLHAEGVHQLLQRRPERSQTVLDALTLKNPSVPREWDMIRPPVSGNPERYRVLAMQSYEAAAPVGRATLAPFLNAWLEQFLDPSTVVVELANGQTIAAFANDGSPHLDLSALDLVMEGPEGLPLVLRTLEQLGLPIADPLPELADTDTMLWRVVAHDLRDLLPKLVPVVPEGAEIDGSVEIRVNEVQSWIAAHDALELADPQDLLGHAWVDLAYRGDVAVVVSLLAQGFTDDPRVVNYATDLQIRRTQGDGFVPVGPGQTYTFEEVKSWLSFLMGPEVPIAFPHDISGFSDDPNLPPFASRLESFARVRPSVDALCQVRWSSEAWRGAQAPPALEIPQTDEHLAYVVGTAMVPNGERFAVWRIDAWEELIPDADVTVGVAMHVDAPASQAPAAWLITVPPSQYYNVNLPNGSGIPGPYQEPPAPPGPGAGVPGGWTVTAIGDLLDDLIRWVQRRGVGSDELAASTVFNRTRGLMPLAVKPPEV